MTEPPKEYIITKDLLQDLEDMDTFADLDQDDDYRGILKDIRSRPVSILSEGAAPIYDPKTGYACWNGCTCDPKCSRIISPEHDAEIAQAAREKVLDAIFAWIDNADNHVKDDNQYFVVLPRIVELLYSLRQPKEQP